MLHLLTYVASISGMLLQFVMMLFKYLSFLQGSEGF
jgi:hypothetical protein